MKSLRMFVLSLVFGAMPLFVMQAYGQQEVDPDHFDQPAAVSANASTPKAQAKHSAASSHKQTKTASKHSNRKSNHHQAQA